MAQETTGIKVKVSWKLEKFTGDRADGDLPVEVIEGEEYLTPEQVKEFQDGFDKRGAGSDR